MKKLLPTIITVIVVGLLAFYGGFKIGQSSPQSNVPGGQNFRQQMDQQDGPNGGNTNFQRRGGQGGQMGNFINGEILSGDDKSITIKMPDGGSKIIFFSGTTKIVKSTDAPVTDLTTGINVMVNGSANTDGSISATNIQIRPAMPSAQQPATTNTQIPPAQPPSQNT
jgi:hypothetical protein